MVVNDFDLTRIAVLPSKTNAPLIVDPDTVLPSTLSAKLLESVSGRDAQILEDLRGIDDHQLAQHCVLELARISANPLPLEEPLGVPIAEAPDHPRTYSRNIITSSVTICGS